MLLRYLQLLRWPNLLLVALTQFLVHEFVFSDAFQTAASAGQTGMAARLSAWQLSALIFSTVCVTAVGYLINDLHDLKIDLINRPERMLAGRHISIRAVRRMAWLLGLAGFLSALWLALTVAPLYYILLYPLGLAALWLYSARLKQLGWPGNLLVSIFCAGVTALVWLAEQNAWWEFSLRQSQSAHALQNLLLLYLLFAFLSNLYREWLKDLQDLPGDKAHGRLTLPVRLGPQKARLWSFGAGLIFLLAVLLFALQLHLQGKTAAFFFLLLFIAAPLLYSLATLFKDQSQQHYKRLAGIAKFIMLTGVLLIVFL
ncbi:MAG TPA: hypothetical protein ENJ88_07460 [Phaeodactylibacter sp.]|nr:hypothetical protein [Phaeodactylibacter sp.]